jgi:hypothetical protein
MRIWFNVFSIEELDHLIWNVSHNIFRELLVINYASRLILVLIVVNKSKVVSSFHCFLRSIEVMNIGAAVSRSDHNNYV